MTLKGQCHCGHIQYESPGPVIKCSNCDCRGCQRATGTLKAPFVTVPRKTLSITGGQPAEFRAATGDKCDAHGAWLFCPKCGSHLFWRSDRGDEIDLFAGSLNDPAVFSPKENVPV